MGQKNRQEYLKKRRVAKQPLDDAISEYVKNDEKAIQEIQDAMEEERATRLRTLGYSTDGSYDLTDDEIKRMLNAQHGRELQKIMEKEDTPILKIIRNLEMIKFNGGPDAFEPLSDESIQALDDAIALLKTPKVTHLCDRKACDICLGTTCQHTSDIDHAVNFHKLASSVGDVYEEKTVKDYIVSWIEKRYKNGIPLSIELLRYAGLVPDEEDRNE